MTAVRFPNSVAELKPDAVVGLISITLNSEKALVDHLPGNTGHLLYYGSSWRHGASHKLPMYESNPIPPIGEYGVQKAARPRC